MGKGGGGAAAPDYIGAAKEQGKQNIDAAVANAYLNNPNIVTPFGSFTTTQTGTERIGSIPSTPGQSFNFGGDSEEGSGGIRGIRINRPGTVGDIKDIPTFTQQFQLAPGLEPVVENLTKGLAKPIGDSSALQNQAEDAYFSRLNPRLERERESRINELSVRGFKPGSTTYETERGILAEQENDARTQAILNALNLRGPLLEQELAMRNQPINEITALMSGSQIGTPQFGGGKIAAPDVLGATGMQGQSMLDAFNARQARAAGNTQAATGLASAAMLAYALSDRRLKRDIKKIGVLDSGIPVYLFRYQWDADTDVPRFGVMADEVEPIIPEAVIEKDGFKAVNYALLR